MINQLEDELIDIRIPTALINDENRILDADLQVKSELILSKQLEIDEHLDRIRMLEEHEKIINEEFYAIKVLRRSLMQQTNDSHS